MSLRFHFEHVLLDKELSFLGERLLPGMHTGPNSNVLGERLESRFVLIDYPAEGWENLNYLVDIFRYKGSSE